MYYHLPCFVVSAWHVSIPIQINNCLGSQNTDCPYTETPSFKATYIIALASLDAKKSHFTIFGYIFWTAFSLQFDPRLSVYGLQSVYRDPIAILSLGLGVRTFCPSIESTVLSFYWVTWPCPYIVTRRNRQSVYWDPCGSLFYMEIPVSMVPFLANNFIFIF